MFRKFYILTSILVLIVSVYPARAKPTVSIKQFTSQQLLNPHWIEQRLAKVGIKKLIADYQDRKEPNVSIVRDALVLSQTILEKHPEALRNQLQGRLVSCDNVALKAFQTLPANSVQLALQSPTLQQAGDARLHLLTSSAAGPASDIFYAGAVSHDGKYLVMRRKKNTEVWDCQSRKLHRTLDKKHHKKVGSIRKTLITSDNQRIIFLSDSDIFSIWNFHSNKIELTFDKEIKEAEFAALGMIRTMDTNGKINKEREQIHRFVITSDDKYLIAATKRRKLHVWSLSTGKLLSSFASHQKKKKKKTAEEIADEMQPFHHEPDWIQRMAVSPDGEKIAILLATNIIEVWDFKKKLLLYRLSLKEIKNFEFKHGLQAMLFSPDSQSLLFCNRGNWGSNGKNKAIILWSMNPNKEVFSFSGSRGVLIDAIGFTRDGTQILTAGDTGRINLWDVKTKKFVRAIHRVFRSVTGPRFSSDGRSIIYHSQKHIFIKKSSYHSLSNGILIGDLEKLRVQTKRTRTVHDRPVYKVLFTSDGKRGISVGKNIVVHNLITHKIEHVIPAHQAHQEIRGALLTPDNKRLLTCSYNKIEEWSIKTGKLVRKFPPIDKKNNIEKIWWTKDKSKFWVETTLSSVKYGVKRPSSLVLWDYQRRKRLSSLITANNMNSSIIDIFPDQSTFVLRYEDKQIALFDTKTKTITHQFGKHQKRLYYIILQADGKNIFFTESESNTIYRMGFESDNGISITEPVAEHQKGLMSLSVSPNGKYLISVYGDNWASSGTQMLKLWDINQKKLLVTYYLDSVITATAFSPDSQSILAGDKNGRIHYWKMLNLPRK
ncbi:High-affnity carbon uptake protein Hat/HatR [hydrothermal vent metagenome]|uniref:High-affnity carbon uptake protein Hat/HatR n=1 Tax=hydrothermal vent metagenome TaxID=652676 RepID=A0A3B1E274_9ZZZZ